MFRASFLFFCTLLLAGLSALPARAFDTPGTGHDAAKTVVYRDTWGVPHIYAPTAAEGLYAMGWAQAQDRPDQLLENIGRAIGESAKFEGKGAVQSDVRSLLFDHYGVAQKNFAQLSPTLQEHMRAFARGMTDYYKAHPEDVPAWWGDRAIDEFMIIAFGRMFLYNWSIDDAYGDLERGGIEAGNDREQRGSNQWAVGPKRSANGASILYIDPHLSWWGPSRFWEVRIHAGELHGSGFTLPGSPYVGLGHNENVAWAMTTGGPDTADIFELTLQDDKAKKYQYDGEWRDLVAKEITIQVKDGEPYKTTIYTSHLGPIVAIHGLKAYAAAMAYQEVVELNESWYKMNIAQDYNGIKDALATIAMFPQNIMVADTSGNIYYQRTGRVPMRPDGYDWSKPVPGDTSKTAWKGFHPSSDLVQLANPEQGYMQNCNIPPDAMMVASPLTPDKYPDYIFSDIGYGPRGGWSSQRGARAVELLSQDDSVTIEDALKYAVDVHPYGVERWIEGLRAAHQKFGTQFSANADYAKGIEDVLAWDQELSEESTGALKYAYWREQLLADHGNDVVAEIAGRVDHPEYLAQSKPYEPVQLSDEEMQGALQSFAQAMATLKSHLGSIDAKWGDKFRVGRDDKSWPVAGAGGRIGITTLRNVNYSDEKADHTRWGRSGQTSTQIVVLSKPVQSWTYVPIGQSDRPNSRHYSDQAEKLFSTRTMKATWWTPEALYANIESREVLKTPEAAIVTAPASEDTAALAGTWKLTMSLEGNEIPATMILEEEDGKLSGSWEDQFGKDPLYDFAYAKGELTFGRDVTYEGQDYAIDFQGKVSENNLTGTFYTEAGPLDVKGAREQAPVAAAPAAAAGSGAAGTWKLTMSFQGTEMPATLLLEEKDGKLAGSWEDALGKDDLYDIKATGDVLEFGREVTYEGSEYAITFEGKLAGDNLSGTFYTEAGPLDVKGSREAAAPAPVAEAPAPATPAAPAAAAGSGAAGTWKLTMSFQGTEMPAMLLLEEKDGKLAGSWEDALGKDDLYDIKATGDVLEFGREVTYEGSEYAITFEGKLAGDDLTGTFYTEAGPLDVKGSREAAAPAPVAETPAPATPAAPAAAAGSGAAGTWKLTMNFQGTEIPATLILEEKDGKLAGSWEDTFGKDDLYDIKASADTLAFGREVTYEGTDYAITFEGKLAGNNLTGTFYTEAGPLDIKGSREAVAAVAAGPDLSGEWKIVATFEGSELPSKMLVSKAANGSYEIKIQDEFGNKPPTDVKFTDGTLSFQRDIEYQGESHAIAFEGKLDGDTIKGAFETEVGSIPVEATRTAAPAAAAPAAPAGIAGKWDVSIEYQGDSFPATLSFEQGADGALSGTWSDQFSQTPPFDIALKEDALSFSRKIEYQGTEYVITFEGKVAGDAIDGEFQTEIGALAVHAKRAAAASSPASAPPAPTPAPAPAPPPTPAPAAKNAALLGDWEVTIDFQGTAFPAKMTFTETAQGVLEGTWADQYSQTPPENIVFDNGALSFERKVDYQGQQFVLAFKGNVEGDTLKGEFTTEMGPLALTAKRTSATPEAAPAVPAEPAAAPAPAENVQPFLGAWNVTVNLQGSELAAEMSISESQSGALSGTWSDQYSTSEPYNVRVKDGQLLFDRKVDVQGQEYVIAFEGTVQGVDLTGRYVTEMGNLELTGKRAAASTGAGAPTLAGEWKVTTVSQLGTMERTLFIRPDLSGWYGAADSQFAVQNLKQEGNVVTFDVTVNIQDTDVPLSFKGTLEASTLKGEFESPYGNATFDGVKQDAQAASGDPKEAILELMANWKKTMEAADLDAAMLLYAEDFKTSEGDKAAAKAYLQNAKDLGYFEGLQGNIDGVEIMVDGASAEIRNVLLQGSFGTIALRFKAASRDGKWLFVEQDQE